MLNLDLAGGHDPVNELAGLDHCQPRLEELQMYQTITPFLGEREATVAAS